MAGVGGLVVVGTPIGNLGDLSPRAAEALRDADVVACEDTRRTAPLLRHAGSARADGARCTVTTRPGGRPSSWRGWRRETASRS